MSVFEIDNKIRGEAFLRRGCDCDAEMIFHIYSSCFYHLVISIHRQDQRQHVCPIILYLDTNEGAKTDDDATDRPTSYKAFNLVIQLLCENRWRSVWLGSGPRSRLLPLVRTSHSWVSADPALKRSGLEDYGDKVQSLDDPAVRHQIHYLA